jgi:hypothetical protein
MAILYSENNNSCYDTDQNYSSYPEDCVEITKEQFETYFLSNPPSGKERAYDSETNTFSWVDVTYTDAEVLSQCKSDLSENRWKRTEQGVTIDDTLIQSDIESKNAMSGYVTESIINGITEVHWKLGDGTFVTYPIAQIKKIYQIITKYRNDCFGVEKTKIEELDSSLDPKSIDLESGWPSTEFTIT